MASHDHELLINGTTQRFNIAKDDKGTPMYTSYYKAFQVQDPYIVGQNDWSGGHGKFYAGTDNKFFDGYSIDTFACPGKVILGPFSNSVGSGAVLHEYSHSETIVGPLNMPFAQTFTPIASHTIKMLKLHLQVVGTPGDCVVSIMDTLAGVPNAVLSSQTLPYSLISTEPPGLAPQGWTTIVLDTPVPVTLGSVYAISVTAPNTTDNYYMWYGKLMAGYAGGQAYKFSGGTWVAPGISDMTFEEWEDTVVALDGLPLGFFWAKAISQLLVWTATNLYLFGGTLWTVSTTPMVGITDICEYNGVLYAAMGTSTTYMCSTDGATWAVTDLTDKYADGFLVAPNSAGTLDILWKFKKPNELSFTTDGTAVAVSGVQWAQPAYVGDTSSDIQNIFIANNYLMIGKSDGLYNYDSEGGVHPLMPELSTSKSLQNFKYVTNWKGSVYFSLGKGICELTNYNSISSMGPLEKIDDIGHVGYCVGLTNDKDYLYVAMQEGSHVHIYKGKNNPDGSWAWCPWVYPLQGVSTANTQTILVVQHDIFDRRLWYGCGLNTYWAQITDNPTADAAARFAPNGLVRMSVQAGSSLSNTKMMSTYYTNAKYVSATKPVQYYRYVDNDIGTSTSYSLGTQTSPGTSNLVTTYPNNAYLMQYAAKLTTDDPAVSPQLLVFEAHGIERASNLLMIDVTYTLSQDTAQRPIVLRNFLRQLTTPTLIAQLFDLRLDPSKSAPMYVTFEAGFPREVEIFKGPGREPDMGIQCRFRAVV